MSATCNAGDWYPPEYSWPAPALPLVTTTILGPAPAPATPHRCPVCEGKGRVVRGFYDAVGVREWTTTGFDPEPCRSCAGTGVLWR